MRKSPGMRAGIRAAILRFSVVYAISCLRGKGLRQPRSQDGERGMYFCIDLSH